jgi:transcriptional regulator with PAS, ATPase and Fis domain
MTIATIATIADSPTTVLILGDAGTGKELVACAIHDAGRGKDNNAKAPIMAINCAAIPEHLLEANCSAMKRAPSPERMR